MVLADAITFGFHYPRNDILFVKPMQPAEVMARAAREWAAGNYARIVVVLIGAISALRALSSATT